MYLRALRTIAANVPGLLHLEKMVTIATDALAFAKAFCAYCIPRQNDYMQVE